MPRRARTGGEHAGPGADVVGQARHRDGRRKRRLRDEVDVLAAHRREDAVVRMDAPAGRGHLDALVAPLVRADEAQELAQRDDRSGVEGPYASTHACLRSGARRKRMA
jgi:hypothetical protein